MVSTDFVSLKPTQIVPTMADAEFEGFLDDVLGSRTEPAGRYGEIDGRPRGAFLVSLVRLAVASHTVTSRQVMRMLDRGASLADTAFDELASLAVTLFSRVVDPDQFLVVINSSAPAQVAERVIKRLGRLNLYSPYALEGRHVISFDHPDDRRFVKCLARLGVAEWVSRHEREMEAQGGFVLAGFEGAVDYDGVRPLQEDFDNPPKLDVPFLTVSWAVDCTIILRHIRERAIDTTDFCVPSQEHFIPQPKKAKAKYLMSAEEKRQEQLENEASQQRTGAPGRGTSNTGSKAAPSCLPPWLRRECWTCHADDKPRECVCSQTPSIRAGDCPCFAKIARLR